MKKVLLFMIILFCNEICYSAINALSGHSRANCVNNETISWDATHAWPLFTTSDHIQASTGTLLHSLPTGWAVTRRSAAVHWGEGTGGGWIVTGHHWIMLPGNKIKLFKEETAKDCDIYDGWWEMK